ncbi:ABC transporter permease [Paenibacillus sp. RC67]|uniref:ABC transporter permease n=1 Tax=Paenibacillus sp. RC67 TaxID=3039392 RepID=UPI0024AC8CF3|nr:ABC transporter permease [Paenibacillus sp. RC67]
MIHSTGTITGAANAEAIGGKVEQPVPKDTTARQKRNDKWAIIIRGLILPISVLIIWQIAGSLELISKTLLPTPLAIFQAFIELTASGELVKHLKISVYRAAVGFLLGGGLGLLLGLVSGLFRRAEETLDPTVQMLRMIPHLAITPLFILWFGFGELSKILLIAKGAFFPLYVNTFLGIRSADSKLFDVARILEFNRWNQITRLVIPAAMPNLLLGLRLSLGVAWLGLVVAELMGSSEGIGYLIMDARQFSQTQIVFVGIIIFAIVGKMTDSLVRLLEKKLLKWRDSYNG